MDTIETSLSPGISIIIVSFNEKERLLATLSSIPADSQNIEVILVVPASDRVSVDLAKSSTSNAIKIVHDRGLGVYQAMNIGVSHANLSHILFLNTGDVITGSPELERCLSEIKKDSSKSLILPVVAEWNNELDKAIPNLSLFLSGSRNGYVSHQGVLFLRAFAHKEGHLDQRYKVSADFKQLCMLYRSGSYKNLNFKLVSIEFPSFSAKYNRRGRFESIVICLIHLRRGNRIKAVSARILFELKSFLKKFS